MTDFRQRGVRVLCVDGISKGDRGVTTGVTQETETGAMLVGVVFDYRYRLVREDWLEDEAVVSVDESARAYGLWEAALRKAGGRR